MQIQCVIVLVRSREYRRGALLTSSGESTHFSAVGKCDRQKQSES